MYESGHFIERDEFIQLLSVQSGYDLDQIIYKWRHYNI